MATVMVVDDEDVLLEMIASLLEDLGHHPLTAINGQEALAILRAGADQPVLILSDVMMPRMNGIELAHALKADPYFRGVPLVLMSAAGRPRDGTIADAFIHKPFEIDMLTALIEQYTKH